jgi:recombination protein RecT
MEKCKMTTQNNVPALLEKMEPEFKKALGSAVPSERFTRIAVTAIKSNPDLANLERASLFKAIMQAAQDGLVIDGKEAAVIPFKGKAQYLPMVAGLLKKMRQHADFANLSHGIIYAGEVASGAFEYVKGDEERLYHKPDLFGDRGEAIGAYAIVTTKDGQKFRAVLTKAEIEKRKNVGRAGGNGPWGSWSEEMWIKTAIKAVYKIAPNSGDTGGVLEQVFGRDEEPIEPEAPADAPEFAGKKQTRAAKAVKEAEPSSEVEDAEVIPPAPEYDDEELPM